MKVCPNCATQSKNDDVFCRKCGGSLVEPAENASGAAGAAIEAEGGDSATEVQVSSPINDILIDQSESIEAIVGSNYLQNFLSGGSVSEGFGILTQKRFYYKGRNYSGMGKEVKSTTTEGVVSLEDIAFTEFTYTRHTGILAFAILLTAAALLLIVAFQSQPEFGLIALFAAVPFYIQYFAKRQTLFLVSFPGGGFAFNIQWYPIADIRDFQRELHLMKDHLKEENHA